MIDRTILLKFKDTTTQEQLQLVVERFQSLRQHLIGIIDLQAGINLSDRGKGYQVVLKISFEDQAALDAYEENPDHRACSAFIRESGRLDGFVVDIEI